MIHPPKGTRPGPVPAGGRWSPTLAPAACVLLAVLLVTGCAAGQGPAEDGSAAPDGGGTTEQASGPERGGTSPTRVGEGDGHPRVKGDTAPFVAASEESGGMAGAADRIRGVSFQVFDGYERVFIDFGRDGGAATGVPRWSLEKPPEGGYVRIRLPGVSSTTTGGESLIGDVMDALYVVRDRGGGMFVDVFAMGAFRYRVTELPEAGQLAVDFREAPDALEHPPTQTGEKVVVLQPREAEEVGSPLSVSGYSRLAEGRTTVTLLDRAGEVLASETVRAEDWTTAWGQYEATLEFSGYDGLATLWVGSESPRGGSFVGTETEVIVREGTRWGDG